MAITDLSGNAPHIGKNFRGIDITFDAVGTSKIMMLDTEGTESWQSIRVIPSATFAGTILYEQSFDDGITWELMNAGSHVYTGTGNENHYGRNSTSGGIWKQRIRCSARSAGSCRCLLMV